MKLVPHLCEILQFERSSRRSTDASVTVKNNNDPCYLSENCRCHVIYQYRKHLSRVDFSKGYLIFAIRGSNRTSYILTSLCLLGYRRVENALSDGGALL